MYGKWFWISGLYDYKWDILLNGMILSGTHYMYFHYFRPGYDASVEASHDAETTGNSGEVEPAEKGGTLRASDNTYSEVFCLL